MNDTSPLLNITGLKTDIRLRTETVHPVDNVDLVVNPGETVGLVGESGSGKTMTGLSIMRLLPNGGHIVSGAIGFEDRDLATLDESAMRAVRGDDIGMVFQDPMTSLNPTMTIGHQIAETVRRHRHGTKAAAMDRAAEVLDLVGMPRPRERLGDYPHQLSGGLRQRVMIAMALSCEPKLLIADEPTTALDVTIQAQILELLDNLKATLGMGMLLITHDMGVIAGRADRVMVMYAGRIVETATTTELFDDMRHPYTEALLASIPQIDQDNTQRLYSIPGLPPDLTNPPDGCRFAPRCLYATAECRENDPQLSGDDPTHRFACFHPRHTSVDEADSVVAEALRVVAENAKIQDRLQLLGADTSAEAEPAAAAFTHGGEPLIDLRNVSKDFNVTAGLVLRRRVGSLHAVTDVSLSIYPGETFGVVGESGCGKTTLARMMVSLETTHLGTGHLRGDRCGRDERAPSSADPAGPPDDVPGPLRLPGSPHAGRQHRGRASFRATSQVRIRPAGRRAADRSRASGQRPQPLPA